jgi:pyridoxamine 5'-phosphate oxidase
MECCTMAGIKELPTEEFAFIASNARFLSLATVESGSPVIRTLGSWAISGTRLFFSTSIHADKVKQIAASSAVSAQLLPEGQELSNLRNLVIDGEAVRLEGDAQKAAIDAISARNPRFKERAEKGQLAETALFEVLPRRVKLLDFSRGLGPAAVAVYQD